MTKLKEMEVLKTKPFFSKPHRNYSEKDKADSLRYHELEKELEEAAKKLKKGDKVVFNWAVKVKLVGKEKENWIKRYGAGPMSNYKFVDKPMVGTIHKPFFIKKRKRMGETDEIPTIECLVGKMIYPVSPNDVEKA